MNISRRHSAISNFLVVMILGFGATAPAFATAPTYEWDNNHAHTGSGYATFDTALNAAKADSFANDPSPGDGCTAGGVSGSFPSWSVVMFSCADLRVRATCTAGTALNVGQRTCDVSPGQPDPQKNIGKICIKNPCDPSTGNKHQIETDYAGVGALPLTVRRYYNSAVTLSTAVGRNWRHHYDRVIAIEELGTRANVFRQNGRALVFNLSGGTWLPQDDISDRLIALTNSGGTRIGWQYITSDGEETETYDAAGKLTSITNREGLAQTLSYNTSGQLTSVTGPFGQTLVFTYNSHGRIATITDPAGLAYAYAYDASGRLISMTPPGGGAAAVRL